MIRHLTPALCLAALTTFSASARTEPSIRYCRKYAAGVPLQVIKVNLNDLNVRITGVMPKFGSGHSEPFGQMIRRTKPTVALTGTFFSVRSRIPIGDIVIDGQLAHFGGLGTALCITDNNEVEFIRPKRYTHQDWGQYSFVMCSGPRLVTNGTAYVEPWSEGFKDTHMLNRNGRLAIGVDRHNRLFIVVTRKPIYLSKLARAMRALGVMNAINLDAGSSLGLHYKGQTLIHPGRWLTNLVLVYQDRNRYEDMKDHCLPIKMRSASHPKIPAELLPTRAPTTRQPAITPAGTGETIQPPERIQTP